MHACSSKCATQNHLSKPPKSLCSTTNVPYPFHHMYTRPDFQFPCFENSNLPFCLSAACPCHRNMLETKHSHTPVSCSPGVASTLLRIQHVPPMKTLRGLMHTGSDVPESTRSAGLDLRYWRAGLLRCQLQCHRAFRRVPMPWREHHQPCGLAEQPASLQRRTGQPGCAFQQEMNLLVASKPLQSAACQHWWIYGAVCHCHPKLRICMASRAVGLKGLKGPHTATLHSL